MPEMMMSGIIKNDQTYALIQLCIFLLDKNGKFAYFIKLKYVYVHFFFTFVVY